MSRALRTASLLFLAAVAASACTVTEPGRPVAAGAGVGGAAANIAYDERTAPYAEAFSRIRTVDICALHDVPAAERITGATGTSLRLGGGLADCELEVSTTRPTASWRFQLEVGTRPTDGWKPVELASTQLLKRPDDGPCNYQVPVADGVGLKIEASYSQAANSGPEPSDAAVCQSAERYLTEVVLPRWKNPPKLADGLTAPRSPLLGKDPCAALAAGVADIAEKPGRERTYAMTDPYACEGGRGSSASRYSVEFTIFSAILDLKGQPVKIGDFDAFKAGGVTAGSCSFEVALEPQFVFSRTERTAYHAGIVIGLNTCDETDVAKKVLDNLVQQPDAPAAKPGAQVIGDLRGS